MKYLTLIIAIVFLASCQDSKKPSYSSKKEVQEIHPGKKLLENNCYVCHSPTATQNQRLAPPMIAIKKNYVSKNTTKEQFIKSMQNWIDNPTQENVKMYGAVRKFGIMPKQAFPEETIKQISDYLFDNDIEEPEWFEKHYNEERGKGNGMGKGRGMQQQKANINFDGLSFGERGVKYALSTKAVLGKNLMRKIQNEGTLKALTFCNEKAYTLTDSMSVVHNAKINRVSDKPRNLRNLASPKEKEYIAVYKNEILNNKEPAPIVEYFGNSVTVYYPIKTNNRCLQCHGKPTSQIKTTTLAAINTLYPNDKAVGYDINQVRGIWRVSFKK